MSQQHFFFSTIQALKRGSRIDSKCKIRSLNPMLDNNGILWSCRRLQFAPDNLDVEKFPIILHAKDKIAKLYIEHTHNICVHQGTEPVKAFVQQRHHIIGLRKTLLRIKYRCFLCRRFFAQNIQPVMVPLPAVSRQTLPSILSRTVESTFWTLLYRRCQKRDCKTLRPHLHLPGYYVCPSRSLSRSQH